MWLFVGLLLFMISPVQAAVCVEDNTSKCAELGYVDTSCEYGGIACPYDTTLWHCAKWTCQDGRYYTEDNKPADYECIEVSYKSLSCYECIIECPNDEVDYNTCWGGSILNEIVKDPSYCKQMGYINNKADCSSSYLACPSDLEQVHCLN